MFKVYIFHIPHMPLQNGLSVIKFCSVLVCAVLLLVASCLGCSYCPNCPYSITTEPPKNISLQSDHSLGDLTVGDSSI